ncbi:helix-turn-helix transcriptional regulator [Cellulomonas persica]|uniref:Transcriptional regulator n=1 Tax=Cellulomonas persica TaxID=76861 RepID=A0A510UZD8_9CELL|nr:LuxR C-terminal-related transcriptional regulator [Cellulomonas persica]GEK18911.1 transcriptional regulator [Cellulomonas persica]
MVRRPALEQLLERAADQRLTIVSAGPGWGKTVAVAQWVAATERQVAWLSLEPHDDAPGAFWSDVLEALRGSGAVPEDNPLRHLRVPAAASHEFRSQLLRALEDLPEPVVLVLDDFHYVQRPDVVDGVEDLLRYPLPLRLVLVTRVDPLVRVHRLRVEGELEEVVAADLAFDAPTVAALAAARGLQLTSQDVARVLEDTDGWPVGVRLQLRSPGGSRATRPDQDASDYLVAEVLTRLDPAMQRVLLMTCVTRFTCADLVEAILPGGDAVAPWRAFAERNDFVNPLGSDGTWFRYHPLLREMLLGRLSADDPDAWRLAHRNAATWLVGHGEPVRALELAARIEDWALFCQVFVDSAAGGLVSVDREPVLDLVERVPVADLAPDAGVELCAGALAVLRGRFHAGAAHVARARELAPPDAPPQLVALLEILAASAARGLGDAATTTSSGAAALVVLDAAPLPTPAWPAYRTLAANAHAVGLFWSGDLVEARERLEALVRATAGAPPLLPALNARSYLALAAALAGDLALAAREAQRVIADARELGWGSYLQCRCAYTAVAWVAVLRGEADEADRMLAMALASDLGGEEPPTETNIHLLQALVAVQRGRSRAARAALRAAGEICASTSPVLADLAWRATAETAQLVGEQPPAPVLEPSSTLLLVAEARAHLMRGEPREALRVARLAQEQARTEADEQTEVEAWLVTAAAHEHTGDHPRCDQALDHAIEVAAVSVLVRPFLLVGAPVLAARLHARLDRHPGELADHVRRMGHHESAAREPEPLIDPLTSRELAILGALPTMQTNSEIAADFYVSVNTVKAHLKALYRKLGVESRREAVRRARELGLLD